MVTGTFILTDSIKGAFDGDLHRRSTAAPTRRSPARPRSTSRTSRARPRRPSPSRCSRRSAPFPTSPTPSAASAASRSSSARTARRSPSAARRTSASASIPTRPQFNTLTLVDGTWPRRERGRGRPRRRPSKKHLEVGQTIGVEANGPVRQMKISGLVKFGGASSLGGATLAGFDLPTAQALFGKVGQARPDPRDGEARHHTPQQLDGRDPEDPAAGHAGADRPGAGDRGRRGHDELHRASCRSSCSRSAASRSSSARS